MINDFKLKSKNFLLPLLGVLLFFAQHAWQLPWLNLLLLPVLFLCTLEAVHHAEVVAQKVGQPFGTLVLALAITTIETALILSVVLSGGNEASAIARDTVFAAVMIILNGIVGISMLAGAKRHHQQVYMMEGANAALLTITAISTLTLILPNFTTTIPGPFYSNKQLFFVAMASLILYGTFVFVQNIKHKDYFTGDVNTEEIAIPKPNAQFTAYALVLLLVNLCVVVALAEVMAPFLKDTLNSIGAPQSLVGVIIACIVLLPEGLSSLQAAQKNEFQKSLNLSLGSALASIGLTIPIVSFIAIFKNIHLSMGIDNKSLVLFMLSLIIASMALRTGKTNILQGVILLLVFFTYLFLTLFP